MAQVQLVRLEASVEASIADDPAYTEAMIRDDWPRVAALVHEKIGRELSVTPVSVDTLEWDGYVVVDAGTREVVGSCAFKGPPGADRAVEIAYFTYPGFEGRGYATLMACRLIELAAGSESIDRVLAHTLPDASASTRVLEKSGMTFVGEVNDPDDGRVWRWEKTLRG